jgi:iron complex outermembrane receptor protein
VRANVGGFPGADGTPVLLAFLGNPHFKKEELMAYELGYRLALSTHLSMDFATYYSDYDNLGTNEPAAPFFETPPSPPHLVLPFTFQNLMHGEAQGLEMAANWKLTDRWMLSPGYAFEQVHLHVDATSKDLGSVPQEEGSSPVHSAQLRSHLNLPHGIGWDASAYFVDRLKS